MKDDTPKPRGEYCASCMRQTAQTVGWDYPCPYDTDEECAVAEAIAARIRHCSNLTQQ